MENTDILTRQLRARGNYSFPEKYSLVLKALPNCFPCFINITRQFTHSCSPIFYYVPLETNDFFLLSIK